jgi:hypothetical protein
MVLRLDCKSEIGGSIPPISWFLTPSLYKKNIYINSFFYINSFIYYIIYIFKLVMF